jgi:hypothetical protein
MQAWEWLVRVLVDFNDGLRALKVFPDPAKRRHEQRSVPRTKI